MNWDEMVKMALETWHPGNNPFLHALMGLTGEAGEMIDLYKKSMYKGHYPDFRERILDELGDFWYYLRIASHLKGVNLLALPYHMSIQHELSTLAIISLQSSQMLVDYQFSKADIHKERFYVLYFNMLDFLNQQDCTIEELTQLNYDKLSNNKHGW
jgi:hypothetical protein